MSDIINKAQRAAEIAQNRSESAWRSVGPALKALSGLMLSNLNSAASEGVDVELAAVNSMTAARGIETEADYEKLTEADALEILSRIDATAQLCIDSETDRVMRELDTAGRKLPAAAIEEVREHREIFAPRLLRSLEQAILEVRNGEERPGQASFFAVFLLTELDVPEAFPILLEALRLAGEGPFEVFGDAVHELVPPLLALFSKGDTCETGELLRDRNVNKFVRWAAADAYKYFVRDGLISRQVAVDALHRQFQESIDNEDLDILAPLACVLGDLAAETALETMQSAYARGLVDESIVSLRLIEAEIAAGEEAVEKELASCRPTGMPDTIVELSTWASFREEPSYPARIAIRVDACSSAASAAWRRWSVTSSGQRSRRPQSGQERSMPVRQR